VERAYIRPYSVAWASSGSVMQTLFHEGLTGICSRKNEMARPAMSAERAIHWWAILGSNQ
jgi:hypothetical protein